MTAHLKKLQAKYYSIDGFMQHFQISLFGKHIEGYASSSEISHKFKFQSEEVNDLSWDEKLIPEFYTPCNNLDILKNKRMVLIIWYSDEIT